MREWHGVVVREEREQGGAGAGAGWWLAVVVVAVGGGGGVGLFMMPSPINTAEVMTQIVFPLYGVTPVDLWPWQHTLRGGRGERSVLCSTSRALLTFR